MQLGGLAVERENNGDRSRWPGEYTKGRKSCRDAESQTCLLLARGLLPACSDPVPPSAQDSRCGSLDLTTHTRRTSTRTPLLAASYA